MLLKLAWRNIWRNKRRTLITAASVFFAVFFAACMSCIQRGTWNHMLDNVVNYYFGYVQVHADGYWDDRSIDNLMQYDPTHIQTLAADQVRDVVPRLESFALASIGNQTKGVLVVGIDPQKEDALTSISNRIVKGKMIEDYGLLVGEGVLENLNIDLMDTVVLLSQGYHGANAANQYPVVGVVKFAAPDLNKQLVLMPLPQAQDFYGAGTDQYTSLVMHIQDKEVVPEVMSELKNQLDDELYEVMDWEEMMPELIQAKNLDTAGANIMLLILYIIISFGIFGTILMMTKDRFYEFGILISIGMRKGKLMFMTWMEIVLIGILGSLMGIAASMILVKYLEVNPIRLTGEFASVYETYGMEPLMPADFNIPLFLTQALIVFLITTFMATYPAYTLWKLQPVEAMKS